MRESAVERKLVTGVRCLGGIAYKFVSPGHSGVPDRIVLLPRGNIIFVELKREDGRLTPLQVNVQRQIRDLGFDCRTLYGKQDVEEFLNEICSVGLPNHRRRVDPIAPEVRAVLGDGPWENSNYTDGCKEADR